MDALVASRKQSTAPAEMAVFPEPSETISPSLPRVVHVRREGAVLHLNPAVRDENVLSVNITRGCVQRCAFCCIRAQPSYPGDDVVYLFTNTAELLKAELAGGRRKPPVPLSTTQIGRAHV